MKKLQGKVITASCVSILGMAAALLLFPGTAKADEIKGGVINCDTILNIRELPNKESDVNFKLSEDAKVTVVGSYEGWLKVLYKDYMGWTKEEYVTLSDAEGNNSKVEAKAGYVNDSGINLRAEPNMEAPIYETLPENTIIKYYEEADGWTRCKKDTTEGYIKSEFVTSGKPQVTESFSNEKTGFIVGTNVNVREKADIESELVVRLDNDKKVIVIAAAGDWYHIKSGENKGWVNKDYIKVLTAEEEAKIKADEEAAKATKKPSATKKPTPKPSVKPTAKPKAKEEKKSGGNPPSSSKDTSSVTAYAKSFLGTKYVYGGSSPSSGFDCSGFVCYVFNKFGVSLSRSSSGMASNGVFVEKSNLQPGDIILFSGSRGGGIGHVGIYIGNGQFIHSSSGKSMQVKISSLSESSYSRRYVTARRVL